MNKKPCLLTTYVAGSKYQAFIPLLVYSCKKAYPEYDVMLFLHEELSEDVKNSLKNSGLLSQVIIKEKVFGQSKETLPASFAGSYRWVLWDVKFLEYQYVYIVDVDMFYIREPKPLHLQHAERMAITGLPFDNLMRKRRILKKNPQSILRRIKYAGVRNFLSFLFTPVEIKRLSGLHFVDVERYYSHNNRRFLDEMRKKLDSKYFPPEVLDSNDEALLYHIATSMGYDCSVLGEQTNPTESLSFFNNTRLEFRPHHGIHLGIFKNDYFENMSDEFQKAFKPILESETYGYYIEKMKDLVKDASFISTYNSFEEVVKTYLKRMFHYYNIEINNYE